jgi:diadenylate cyclase
VSEAIQSFLDNLVFVLQRLDWFSALDIFLVTLIFFGILLLLRDTQAVPLLRGVVVLLFALSFVASFELLPAFSWLIRTTLPALIFAIPVIFAPEIRRALERLGRVSAILTSNSANQGFEEVIAIVVQATSKLAAQRHGALIVLQRSDGLQQYVESGIRLDAQSDEKLLMQIFHPNTPLHDGAVVMAGGRILAAACVMPLAAGDIQVQSPGRQIGLRHRAAIGISELSDAVAIVVSEETGSMSIASGGRLIRRLDATRLENLLAAFYRPSRPLKGLEGVLARIFQRQDLP